MKPLDGILKGTDRIIDQHLLGLDSVDSNVRSYRHKGEASNLIHKFDAEEMLRDLIDQIRSNRKYPSHSKENWREGVNAIQEAKDLDALKSKSQEVFLERKIAQCLKEKYEGNDSPWWNQMPIASGLMSSTADHRRAIDLVHRHDITGKQYDFVELKIDSDTPLFALTEILRYGLVYLVLREDRNWLHEDIRKQPVFNAEKIGLRVLAPKEYYVGDLSWFEKIINGALPKIISELQLSLPLSMDIGSNFHAKLKKKLDQEILDHPLSVLEVEDWEQAYPPQL